MRSIIRHATLVRWSQWCNDNRRSYRRVKNLLNRQRRIQSFVQYGRRMRAYSFGFSSAGFSSAGLSSYAASGFLSPSSAGAGSGTSARPFFAGLPVVDPACADGLPLPGAGVDASGLHPTRHSPQLATTANDVHFLNLTEKLIV
jgi:hypothetical protein